MTFLSGLRLIVFGITATGITGCAEGKDPFRMVQFCLESSSEIPAFTSFMRELAGEYQLSFYDRSMETHEELRSLVSENKNVPINDRTVNIGAQRGDAFSFGAGNLGMPADQIVIGFNGNELESAKTLSNSIVQKLSSRWRVHEIATGKGAFPLTSCD